MRRQAAIVVVAALVLLSGCSLLGGPTPTGTDDPTSTATATPRATASPTPAPYPSGYAASGVTNATAARQGHVEGLLSAANFTLGYNATVRTENGTSRITLVQAVSPAEPRAVSDTLISASGTRGSGAVRRTRFYANGTQYLRVQRGGNTTYGTIDGTVPPATFVGRQYVDAALTNVTYDRASRVERSGGAFFRFTADDIEDPGALLSSRVAPENVTGGNVTLVVNGDGVVQSVRYRATVQRDGRPVRYGVAFAIAGIDRTPVQRPEWAREG
ncbi:DUF7537 family lipoprotein [Haloglomus litoreum]|uniref:DUF7537 family lipoprotein n=1 Tax=Haloglomus litoreum TaxID=3034026 RepID=UPI0023E8C2FD|nr:hypothetical protein [Haloglomus sp. DT116]